MTKTSDLGQMLQSFKTDVILEMDALCTDQTRDPKRLEELLVLGSASKE